MEQDQQNSQSHLNKKEIRRHNKLVIWAIILIVIIGLVWFVGAGKYLDVYYFVRGLLESPSIELQAFGFDLDNPMTTQLALGESTCVLLQGASTSKISNITFNVDYGSIEVEGKKVAHKLYRKIAYAQPQLPPDDCSWYIVFGSSIEPWEKFFVKPFKYIAPEIMPPENKDTITVQITNKQGVVLERVLTVNLVASN